MQTTLGGSQTSAESIDLGSLEATSDDGNFTLVAHRIGCPRGILFSNDQEIFAPHVSIEDAHIIIEDLSALGGDGQRSDTQKSSKTVLDVIRKLQLEYVCSVLLVASRWALGTKDIVATSKLVEAGITSTAAASVIHVVGTALNTDVELEVLLRDDITIFGVAELVYQHIESTDKGEDIIILPAKDESMGLPSAKPPPCICDILQILGILVLVVASSVAIIPSYYFGLHVMWHRQLSLDGKKVLLERGYKSWENFRWSSLDISWSALLVRGHSVLSFGWAVPCVILVFAVSLTFVTVLLKWMVIGRYRACVIEVGSYAYLSWWLIDRQMDVWFLMTGQFLQDTVLVNIVYVMLGADVALTASVDSRLKEADLVTVGEHAVVRGLVYARSFDDAKSLRLAPIVVERGATVAGGAVVMPGAELGPGASLASHSLALYGTRLEAAECSDIDTVVLCDKAKRTVWCTEILKLCWLLLYFFVSFLGVAALNAVVFDAIDLDTWRWRYRPLAFWVLSYWSFVSTSLIVCVMLKWLLLGKVRPGSSPHAAPASVFIVDFVWRRIVCNYGQVAFASNGRIGNAIWIALGVDISWTARFTLLATISASQADLIRIGENTLLSVCTIDCEMTTGDYEFVDVGPNATVGLRARLEAGSVMEASSALGNQTVLAEGRCIHRDMVLFGAPNPVEFKRKEAEDEALLEADSIFAQSTRLLLLIFLSFVCMMPSYELAVKCFFGDASFYNDDYYHLGVTKNGEKWTPPMPRFAALLLVGPIFLVAIASMNLFFRAWVFVALADFDPNEPRNGRYLTLYRHYFEINRYVLVTWTFAFVRGSRVANWLMRFYGARVADDAVMNMFSVVEAPLIEIGPGCVLDDASVQGHVLEYDTLRWGTVRLQSGAGPPSGGHGLGRRRRSHQLDASTASHAQQHSCYDYRQAVDATLLSGLSSSSCTGLRAPELSAARQA